MPSYSKKIAFIFLAVFLLGNVSPAQASFLDIIRALVTINPLEIEVSAPSEVEVNKIFKIEVKATNKGEERIEKAKGEIFLPQGITLLRKNLSKKMGAIPGGRQKNVFWMVKGEDIGNYFISVRISGELNAQELSKEKTIMIEIKKEILPAESQSFNPFRFLLQYLSRF